MATPNTIQFGGYDVTKDWKKVQEGDNQIYFNPNDVSQNFTYQGTLPPSALEEFLGTGFSLNSLSSGEGAGYGQGLYTKGVAQPGAVNYTSQINELMGGKWNKTNLINNYDQSANEKLLDNITGQNLAGSVGQSSPSAGVAKTKMVNGVRVDIATGKPYVPVVSQLNSNTTRQPVATAFTLSGGQNLKSGSSGTDVSNLQTLLGGLTVDGKFGPQTQAAVIAFQKANGLTPDGIVGPNTVAMLNAKNGTGSSSNLTAPSAGGVSSGVPSGSNSSYTPPGTTAGAANDVYYQSLSQQVTTLQQKLDKEYARQLQTIQEDKQRAQEELSDIRDSEKDAIDATGKLAKEEKALKLKELDIEKKRFDENYNLVQGLASQLTNLMTEGNALIMSQKGVTGLGLIRNPRVTETINNITAAAGVIQAGIDVYNGQMNQAQNQLTTATNVITSAFSDEIDYYKSLGNFYESMAGDKSAELKVLTSNEQDFLQAKITMLEADVERVKDTSQAIQNAMMDPDTALAYASAGVTLNDSPEMIAQKLGKYGYSKELADQSNEMASNGYTALTAGNAPAGSEVVTITDSAGKTKTYYKKASAKSPSGNFNAEISIPEFTINFESITGSDNYVDPQEWIAARTLWGLSGGSDSSFVSNFKKYLNPLSYSKAGLKQTLTAEEELQNIVDGMFLQAPAN